MCDPDVQGVVMRERKFAVNLRFSDCIVIIIVCLPFIVRCVLFNTSAEDYTGSVRECSLKHGL